LRKTDIDGEKRKMSDKRKPYSNWWCPAIIMPLLGDMTQPELSEGYWRGRRGGRGVGGEERGREGEEGDERGWQGQGEEECWFLDSGSQNL
jgi:hypothetical protein